MGNIRISVAVASYNGERYIKEQMDSIVRNLTCRDEIIVSDDGSSDRTRELVREYQNGEIPVRLLQGPGLGIKQNINAALSACRGDYIFLADQDDVWTDDKVEKVMEYLGKDGCRLVCHDARVMNASFTEVKMESFFSHTVAQSPGFSRICGRTGIWAAAWRLTGSFCLSCCPSRKRSRCTISGSA